MAVERANFSGIQIPPPPYDQETEFIRCNFSQSTCLIVGDEAFGVRLWPGDDTPRTFTQCNLINCEPPPGSTIVDCNTALKEVVQDDDEVEVGVGGIVLPVRYKRTFMHGRLNPNTGQYERHVTKIDIGRESERD